MIDDNMRCPEAVGLLAVHIHDGRAGTNGDIVYTLVNASANPVKLPSGFGTAQGVRVESFMDGPLNEFVNALVRRPEDFYMDVHIERFPDGSTRGQFGQSPEAPVIDAVLSANVAPANTVAAPGGLITIFGRNLAKVGTNIDGWQGVTLPDSLNGVAVGIGSLRPRPIFVSPSQITAVLPLETPSGTVQLAVNNGSAVSRPFALQVAATAPALFANPIVKVSDFSQISAMNPAQAGDVILVYLTGLGQTTPPLASGVLVDESNTYSTVPVTVTVGGKEAQVLISSANPGLPGLYQVVLRIPSGTASGITSLVLHAGSTNSNPVSIPIR